MDTGVLAPTPSSWFSIESLGGNSLFLGQNYPMMVEGDPAAIDTMLLPFMRSNCVYTLDITMLPYRPNMGIEIGRFAWMTGLASVSRLTVDGPSQRITSGSKQVFPTPTSG